MLETGLIRFKLLLKNYSRVYVAKVMSCEWFAWGLENDLNDNSTATSMKHECEITIKANCIRKAPSLHL